MEGKKKVYESVATITSIKVSSRASIKIRDNYYTVEYTEERSLPSDCNVEKERHLLWECANYECDNQIQEIKELFEDNN